MRHNNKLNHLGRHSAHRKAMLANMATSLILHKRISTTLAKAKALRVYVEPLLTKAKTDDMNSRRLVFSYLRSKEAVTELFRNIAEKIVNRPGGYTRILRTGFRLGDAAEMCIIELVDYNENMLKEKAVKKAARTRRSGKKADTVAAPAPKAKAVKEEEAPAVEDVAEETPTAETVEVAETPVVEEETKE
ncbi:MAG: 50S ribosomal protein L17 [Paludibacter sp.]|jgi:large subunit ribosomal protein L17|nr:50S ribosomal protein L17 [Paludibacter sp.]